MRVRPAVSIAVILASLGTAVVAAKPKVETKFFNGKDLTGWSGDTMSYWSVEDGAIVGRSEKKVPHNTFLWSNIEVRDFYLLLDVKLDPNDRNAGIQFRSSKKPPHEALGYQADVGKNVWGRLYHESGRGKLDWTDRGEKAVKPGEWNRYEILAVGDRIWTAINGTLSVAVKDPKGERQGLISLQIHSGAPQTVRYRIRKLIHDPKVELAGMTEAQLKAAAKTIEDKSASPPALAPTNKVADPTPAPAKLKFTQASLTNATGPVRLAESPFGGKRLPSMGGKDAWNTLRLNLGRLEPTHSRFQCGSNLRLSAKRGFYAMVGTAGAMVGSSIRTPMALCA